MATLPLAPLPHAGRNQVFTALFNLLSTTAPPIGQQWVTKSQRVRLWSDAGGQPANQPALFMQRGPQIAESKHVFGVTKWQWKAMVWVFYQVGGLKTDDDSTYPDQLTDQFLDNFEQIMQTDPLDGRQTLGGLVYHVWIDGTIFTEAGIEDGQAFILIPLSILL